MKATEQLRAMFIENATKRGFTNVTWRQVDGKGVFFAYLGRGGPESEPLPDDTCAIIWKAIKPAARKAGLI